MARLIMFAILAVVILASAIFCVSTKRIMRAATALLFVLFGVAGLYFLLDYTFLGVCSDKHLCWWYYYDVYLCNPIGEQTYIARTL